MKHDYCRDLYAVICYCKLVIRQDVRNFPITLRFRRRAEDKSLCLTELQQLVQPIREDTFYAAGECVLSEAREHRSAI
jgi:hypothetical protein